VILPKVPDLSPDYYTKAASNIDSNSPRNPISKVLMRNGPLRQIWFYAMGHYGKFGCALWATAANLVIRYGSCGKFGDALWATAWYEVVQ
jgi:hypothetical protein